jgi:hypothetical protein
MLEPDYGDPTDEERSGFMNKVTSSDGTQIAFDRLGDGPPVIVVGLEMTSQGPPEGEEIVSHMRRFGLFLHTLEGIRARRGAEAMCLGPQSGVTFALDRPTSPFAQACRLARLAVIGLETIARTALVPDDVGLVSEDRVPGDGVIGGRRPFEAAAYHHTAREAGGS